MSPERKLTEEEVWERALAAAMTVHNHAAMRSSAELGEITPLVAWAAIVRMCVSGIALVVQDHPELKDVLDRLLDEYDLILVRKEKMN